MSENHLQELRDKCSDIEDNLDKVMLENRELDKRVGKLEDKNNG